MYEGKQPKLPFEWKLRTAGWCWIGVPATQDVFGLDLTLVKEGVVRSPAQDARAYKPWFNWNWIFWDPVERAARIVNPFGGGDDTWLHPWYGYRVWANTENVTIVFP